MIFAELFCKIASRLCRSMFTVTSGWNKYLKRQAPQHGLNASKAEEVWNYYNLWRVFQHGLFIIRMTYHSRFFHVLTNGKLKNIQLITYVQHPIIIMILIGNYYVYLNLDPREISLHYLNISRLFENFSVCVCVKVFKNYFWRIGKKTSHKRTWDEV